MDYLATDLKLWEFWLAVLQIIGVNAVLSGDNAVVIALACMHLPARQRVWGMVLGAAVAVALRILFTLIVAHAMEYPYLKLIGGALLLWIAVKLVVPVRAGGSGKIEPAESLMRAIWIVAIADIVMSLDNVIAIAASAQLAAASVDPAHAPALKTVLIAFGLATSIPLIVAGSAVLMTLLQRFPVLIWAGGALLGWVAGDIIMDDEALLYLFPSALVRQMHYWVAALGAAFVLALGYALIRARRPVQGDI